MTIRKQWSGIILALILVIAAFIRLWRLDSSPSGLLTDEAHYGYISYSLLETGRDEHGVAYPLIFTGFGDQKLPAYAYSLLPLIGKFGLSTEIVRLPSVIAGVLIVAATYLLLKALEMKTELALIGSGIVALSPWSFILSRFAYESNIGLLLFTVGLICFIKSIRNLQEENEDHFHLFAVRWLFPLLTGLFWAGTWYSYIAYRPVTVALLLIGGSYLLLRRLISVSSLMIMGISFVITVAPLFQSQLLASNTARFNQVGILSDPGIVLTVNENRTFCRELFPQFICYGLWNKPYVIGKELAHRLVQVFSPQYLFVGDKTSALYLSVQGYGQFYLFLLPIFILGLVSVFFVVDHKPRLEWQRVLLLLGLMVTPIPAILSGEPQKVRLAPLLPFLIIVIMMGVQTLSAFIINERGKHGLTGILAILLIASSIPFLINFYTIHTLKNDLVYESYVGPLFETVERYADNTTQVMIKPFFSDPILHYAYHQRIDPTHYQQAVVLGQKEESGFQHAVALDNIRVSEEPMLNLGCQAIETNTPTLYVTNEYFKEIPFVDRVASHTGAIYYAYIYDAYAYASSHPQLCH